MSMTKLDAVNQMLDAITEAPVNSLTAGLPEAEKAERFLDRISTRIQTTGWHCNTDEEWPLTADNDGRFEVSTDVIKIDTAKRDAHIDVTVRTDQANGKRYLYDRTSRSMIFTQSQLTCEIVWQFPFADLTPELQAHIAAVAAGEYQKSVFSSAKMDALLQTEIERTWTELLDAEVRQADQNMVRNNPHVSAVVSRNSYLYGRT